MQTKPFAVKQTAKEKEVASDKLITKEPLKDGQDGKIHKDQKDQKDQKETKEHKEQKEAKEHKEKLEKEKHEHKEISKEHIAKEAALEKLPEAQQQVELEDPTAAALAAKLSDTPVKIFDHKTQKDKLEKNEAFDKVHNEKLDKDILDKTHRDTPIKYFEGPQDPGGPVEARLAALEANMAQLMHFIPAELRPDLSQGALKQEPDAPAATEEPATEPTAKEHKKK